MFRLTSVMKINSFNTRFVYTYQGLNSTKARYAQNVKWQLDKLLNWNESQSYLNWALFDHQRKPVTFVIFNCWAFDTSKAITNARFSMNNYVWCCPKSLLTSINALVLKCCLFLFTNYNFNMYCRRITNAGTQLIKNIRVNLGLSEVNISEIYTIFPGVKLVCKDNAELVLW